jgi:hypothetical protein
LLALLFVSRHTELHTVWLHAQLPALHVGAAVEQAPVGTFCH